MFPRLNGTRGGFCGSYSRGCYSDVRDARLCREFVKEESGRRGLLNYKGLRGQGKLINAEINKLFWPPSSCAALGEVLSLIFSRPQRQPQASRLEILPRSLVPRLLLFEETKVYQGEGDRILSQITRYKARSKRCGSSGVAGEMEVFKSRLWCHINLELIKVTPNCYSAE